MTIFEYLNITRKGACVDNNFEDEKIRFWFDKMLNTEPNIPIEIIMIESNKATCSTVKIDSKYYIVWDVNYWKNVYAYLITIIMYDLGYKKTARLLYNLILFDSLFSRLDNFKARDALEIICKELKDEYAKSYYEEVKNQDIVVDHILTFLKFYVFRHEMIHIFSKEKPKIFNLLKSTLFDYQSLITSIDEQRKMCPYDFVEDENIKDEIICDTFAYTFCARSFECLNVDNSRCFHADLIAIKNSIIELNNDILFLEKTIHGILKSHYQSEKNLREFINVMNKQNQIFWNRTTNYNIYLFSQLNRIGINVEGISDSKYNNLYNDLHLSDIRLNYIKKLLDVITV